MSGTKCIKLAVQKSGRLYDDSTSLLRQIGISVRNSKNQLRVKASNFPLEIFFLRNSDIPKYVESGVADLGIVGENLIQEQQSAHVEIIERLGFSRCRLSIAVADEAHYKGVEDLHGKKIATSYPTTLRRFLEANGVEASIHTISGSVEIAPSIGLADAVCDLVSSGNTLFVNGLREVETILHSEACVIGRTNPATETKGAIDTLLFRIQTLQRAKNKKYIMLNIEEETVAELINLIPGMKSPTIVPLSKNGWVSVQSVIEEEVFWHIAEKLKQIGARDILLLPIEKILL